MVPQFPHEEIRQNRETVSLIIPSGIPQEAHQGGRRALSRG